MTDYPHDAVDSDIFSQDSDLEDFDKLLEEAEQEEAEPDSNKTAN